METQKELFRIGVSVNGVKKRCRKSESHYLSGGYIPFNGGFFNQVEIENLAKGILETNMKRIDGKVFIILNHVKVADGIETWELFGKTNVKFELKSSLENALQ